MITLPKHRLFLLLFCALASLCFAAEAPRNPRIFMIGGSTMADFPPGFPKIGWGQAFPQFFREASVVQNRARSGRSSKSFIDEGRWDAVLSEMRAGDYLIVHFGTNDSKKADPARYTEPRGSFKDNLERMIRETLARGAHPILATSLAKRAWDKDGRFVDDRSEYVAVTREIAEAERLPLLEMRNLSMDLERGCGVEDSKKLHVYLAPGENENYPEGLQDNTHYSLYGATRIAELAVRELRRLNHPLVALLKPEPEVAVAIAGGEDETRPVGALAAGGQPLYKDSSQTLEARVDDVMARLTLDEKLNLLGGIKDLYARGIERLDIPEMKMADGPLGVRQWGESTLYPATMLLAATWNEARAVEFGESMGRDARARNVHVLLGPGVNIYRSPMNGRNFEYMGEDPFLAARLVAAEIRAMQAQGVAASVKHFAVNNTEIGRLYLSSEVDERALREIYFPVFRAAVVEGGAWTVMGSYNRINGTYASENAWLNNEVLKKEWGFKGVLMSDWGATHDTLAAALGGLDLEMGVATFFTVEKLRPLVDSGKISLSLVDDKARRMVRLLLVGGWLDGNWWNHPSKLDDPRSSAAALDIAREGITLLKNEGGLLPLSRGEGKNVAVLGPNAARLATGLGSGYVRPFRAVSFLDGIRARAGASTVLAVPDNPADPYLTSSSYEGKLKLEFLRQGAKDSSAYVAETNRVASVDFADRYSPSLTSRVRWLARWSGQLPVVKAGDYEFVLDSSDAHVRVSVDGKEVWRSNSQASTSFLVSLPEGRSVAFSVEAEQRKSFLPMNVRLGWGAKRPVIPPDYEAAVRKAEAAVVCVGFGVVAGEGEGHDRPYALPGRQEELIRETARLNPRTVVVLNAGASVSTTDWLEGTPALLHAFFAGQEGGTALGEILFGDVNPSGRLPFTWEKRWEDCAAFQSGYPDVSDPKVKTVEYKEGIFVGYRWFDSRKIAPLFPFGHGLSYTSFEYGRLSARVIDDEVLVTVSVTNTGARPGAEVVQLYVGQPACSVPRPVRELKGFAKVYLAPGESRQVEMTLPHSAFSFFHPEQKRWTVEPGEFVIEAGSSASALGARTSLRFR